MSFFDFLYAPMQKIYFPALGGQNAIKKGVKIAIFSYKMSFYPPFCLFFYLIFCFSGKMAPFLRSKTCCFSVFFRCFCEKVEFFWSDFRAFSYTNAVQKISGRFFGVPRWKGLFFRDFLQILILSIFYWFLENPFFL